MAKIKYTKNALRLEQLRLTQLNKYLPTLQLKKSMLQMEVDEAERQENQLQSIFHQQYSEAKQCSALLQGNLGVIPKQLAQIKTIEKVWDNIAGLAVPCDVNVAFVPLDVHPFTLAPWIDGMEEKMQSMVIAQIKVTVQKEKLALLREELRKISIRVNLFEKILIPRTKQHIREIKVFLGDQELAAVARAKVAKKKIEEKKKQVLCALM